MVSKYSQVAWWEDILASQLSNFISGTQMKQTSFHKFCHPNKKNIWYSELKELLCICKTR